jgi:hypothetical protein
MKAKLISKFLFAVSFGGLFGRYIQWDYERWHRLGRDAYLSNQAHRFDL